MGVLAVATSAWAQPSVAEPVDGVTPSFVLMDVDGERSQIETEVGMGFSTGGAPEQLWSARLRAQVMLGRTFGVYAALQGGGVTGQGESDFGLGNLELGGVVHFRPSVSTDVSFHAGLVPSLKEGALGGELVGITVRPVDLPLVLVGTSWVRGGASATYHNRAVFARVDLGVDQEVNPKTETLVHVNAGVGFGDERWSVAAELQVLFLPAVESTAEVAGVSLRYHGTTVSPYFSVTAPVGGDLFKDLMTISAGASFGL